MDRWHVDVTGPHPRTPRGSKYILTCVDAFSNWAEAFAMPNKEARIIAQILVVCRFGTPVAPDARDMSTSGYRQTAHIVLLPETMLLPNDSMVRSIR